MEPIQPPAEVITELSFPNVKRSERESHHSLTSSELHLHVLIWKGKTEWAIHLTWYVTFEVKDITINSCPCRGLNDSSVVQPLSLVIILTTLSEIKLWQWGTPAISPRYLIMNFVTENISWRDVHFWPEDRTEPHMPSCRSMRLVPKIKRLLCP
jgi:hypothetical protein